MLLTPQFLKPYYARGDVFPNLLARSVYLSKYKRLEDSGWTDTIARVVSASCNMGVEVSKEEAEQLFDLFWHMKALPSGRAMWTSGATGIPPEAFFNCWFTSIRTPEDWAWAMNNLMLGSGVGVGLKEIYQLPVVCLDPGELNVVCSTNHPDMPELNCPAPYTLGHIVPDSRQGWVGAFRQALAYAFAGKSLCLDVSEVRAKGELIRGFGGISSGPAPLVSLIRSVWGIIRGAAGRKINSVEALDITNFIGLAIKAGNVRRSAIIVLGDPADRAFREAKKDYSAILSHRHTSNNSIILTSEEDLNTLNYEELAADIAGFGEPGVCNLHLARQTDPTVSGFNPCSEQVLEHHEACNLAEVFPAAMPPQEWATAFRLTTRYCMRQRLRPLTLPEDQEIAARNMRVGVAIGGVCDFDYKQPGLLQSFYGYCRDEADLYAKELGVNRPIKVTTCQPSGTKSLMAGASPGMHAQHAPFYIRRVRMAINDPMTLSLITAGVPFELCKYDQTSNTYVFSFPSRAPNPNLTKESETLLEQFERQLFIQENYSDSAVSATINFKSEETSQLPELLSKFVPRLKATSCLPTTHGYEQAPYESIAEAYYWQLCSLINAKAGLNVGGMEIDECQGGACPAV